MGRQRLLFAMSVLLFDEVVHGVSGLLLLFIWFIKVDMVSDIDVHPLHGEF